MGISSFLQHAIPLTADIVGQRQQFERQDREQGIRDMLAIQNANRQAMQQSLAEQIGAANIGKTNAQAENYGRIPVKTIQDEKGAYQAIPTKITPGQAITPLSTGVQGIVKPVTPPKIDPLSPQGVTAAGDRAGAVAKAKAPYATPKATPRDPLVKTVGPDGKPIYTPTSQAAGQQAPSAAGNSGALSGQTMQTLGRLGMSFNDLKQALDQMDSYENQPGNLAKQTPFKQAVGAASEAHPSQEAHGLMGALNNAAGAFVGAKAQQQIGQNDPEYRTYLNNKQRVATAFTELLPRPNQQLLQLEKGLSGADVGWNPQLIKNIQARRRGGLDVLKNILGQQGMLNEQGDMTGRAPGKGDPGGNIDLRQAPTAPPATAPKKPKNDYGIFGGPPGGGE